uniref:THIF-type NAD/FAD binding fold domain-containing protein n=1 Tax=Timema tahoe TaxID=61484 RepID=A0A7R9NWD5_9NEOP|nr:unnamed protein product [Timema tahoe]
MKKITESNLSKEESEQYDRQIRLWGLESQKRIRATDVLVVGIGGFGAEVCKNIILAGVHSVTMLDHKLVTELDRCSQFLAPTDNVGKNRAEASLSRAQELNIMVTVRADTDNVEDKSDAFFQQFNIVVATECSQNQLVRINNICRDSNVLFFCGDVFGIEKNTKVDKLTVTTTIKKEMTCVPLQDALATHWDGILTNKLKKMDPSYFLLLVLLAFRKEKSRDPNPAERAEDIIELKKLRNKTLSSIGVPPEKVSDELFSYVFARVSPVCAIVGGIMAQEIIKAASKLHEPYDNMFFFNPTTNGGFIECVGK